MYIYIYISIYIYIICIYIYIMCIYIYMYGKITSKRLLLLGNSNTKILTIWVLPESSRNGPPQATEALPVPSSCLETVTTEDRGCLTVDIGEKDGKKMEDAIYIYIFIIIIIIIYIYICHLCSILLKCHFYGKYHYL